MGGRETKKREFLPFFYLVDNLKPLCEAAFGERRCQRPKLIQKLKASLRNEPFHLVKWRAYLV